LDKQEEHGYATNAGEERDRDAHTTMAVACRWEQAGSHLFFDKYQKTEALQKFRKFESNQSRVSEQLHYLAEVTNYHGRKTDTLKILPYDRALGIDTLAPAGGETVLRRFYTYIRTHKLTPCIFSAQIQCPQGEGGDLN
jgi:hypothetical protein